MKQEKTRDLFRRYLLDTASDSERRRVDALLEAQPELRGLLEDERRRLDTLDLLEDRAPTRDLAAAVVQQVQRERASQPRPFWRALAPYAAIAAALVVIIGAVLPALNRAREALRTADAQTNLKMFGIAMKMYANESRGNVYPPLAPYDGVWMVDLQYLIPEYLPPDPAVLVHPAHPLAGQFMDELAALLSQEDVDWERVTRIVAQSYVYPGWMLTDEEDLPAFTQGARQLAKADHPGDLHVGDKTFFRYKEGIERFLITDINNPAASAQAQSTIPVLFENASLSRRNRPDGINVLYMDGHVEFLRSGEGFPATEAAASAFPPPPLE
jgi:prepilin-type processing-associated H-X9-DG protein